MLHKHRPDCRSKHDYLSTCLTKSFIDIKNKWCNLTDSLIDMLGWIFEHIHWFNIRKQLMKMFEVFCRWLRTSRTKLLYTSLPHELTIKPTLHFYCVKPNLYTSFDVIYHVPSIKRCDHTIDMYESALWWIPSGKAICHISSTCIMCPLRSNCLP